MTFAHRSLSRNRIVGFMVYRFLSEYAGGKPVIYGWETCNIRAGKPRPYDRFLRFWSEYED